MNHIKVNFIEQMHKRVNEMVEKQMLDQLVHGRSITKIEWDSDQQKVIAKPNLMMAELEALKAKEIESRKAAASCVIKLPEGYSIDGEAITGFAGFCAHEFVNVSFAHIKMVCKHCDREQI